jgi:hypothetical protein
MLLTINIVKLIILHLNSFLKKKKREHLSFSIYTRDSSSMSGSFFFENDSIRIYSKNNFLFYFMLLVLIKSINCFDKKYYQFDANVIVIQWSPV